MAKKPTPFDTAEQAVLRIVGPEKGRRRAGFQFGREPTFLVVDDLTEAQAELLASDPLLIITGEYRAEPASAEDPSDSGATE